MIRYDDPVADLNASPEHGPTDVHVNPARGGGGRTGHSDYGHVI